MNKGKVTFNERPLSLRKMANMIAADMECLRQYDVRATEEVMKLAEEIPILVLKDMTQFVQWAREHRVSLHDAYALLAWAGDMKGFLAGVDVYDNMSFDEVWKAFDLVQTNSIVLHRINYLLHEQMINVYDILERDRKLRFLPRKYFLKAEDCWINYVRPRQKNTERAAWSTLQDHLRIAADVLQPRLQQVYSTARDRMIFLGYHNVELLSRIVVALTVAKVQHMSFLHFFLDFKRDKHCDFRRLFASDDMLPMIRAFADMINALGIAVKEDEYGLPTLADFDINQSIRVGWAWKSFMQDLRDVDLMDDAARRAIELNPIVREDYKAVLEQAKEERRQAERQESAKKLSDKFKVTKL